MSNAAPLNVAVLKLARARLAVTELPDRDTVQLEA